MAFYLRNDEISLLRRQLWLSEHQRSRMTLIYGEPNSGKTSLAARALSDGTTLYLKTGNRTESMMLAGFSEQISRKLKKQVSNPPKEICTMLKLLFGYSTESTLTFIIDGFDYYLKSNSDELYNFCEIWKDYRSSSHINLVIIVDDEMLATAAINEKTGPLSALADLRIRLDNFKISELKTLMSLTCEDYSNEDLLFLYGITGGVPEYVGKAIQDGSPKLPDFVSRLLCEDSYYIREGDNILNSVIGHNKDIYVSIIQAIASGKRTQSEIEAAVGKGNVGGHLYKLEKDFGLVVKVRPALSANAQRNVVRYEIKSTFLLMWLRTIDNNRDLVASCDFNKLREFAFDDFGKLHKYLLVRYFRNMLQEQYGFTEIGGQWESSAKNKKDGTEADIISVDDKNRKAFIAAVEKSVADFNKEAFLETISNLEKNCLKGYKIDSRLFTLEDM